MDSAWDGIRICRWSACENPTDEDEKLCAFHASVADHEAVLACGLRFRGHRDLPLVHFRGRTIADGYEIVNYENTRKRSRDRCQDRRQWYKAWIQEHGPCDSCGTWSDLHISHPTLREPYRLFFASSRVLSDEKRGALLNECRVVCRLHGRKSPGRRRKSRAVAV